MKYDCKPTQTISNYALVCGFQPLPTNQNNDVPPDQTPVTNEHQYAKRDRVEVPPDDTTAEIGVQCEIWSTEPKQPDPKDAWIPNGAKLGHRLNIDLFSNTQYIG